MTSTQLAWRPREGKSLCIIELDLAPDIARAPYPLDAVLRMCIDFCWWSVRNERRGLDPQPPPAKSRTDFKTMRKLSEYLGGQREEAGINPLIPAVEVIPPTTLFTDPTNPGVRINLGLPPQLIADFRLQFAQKWQELEEDVRHCGVGTFLDWYKIASLVPPFGGSTLKGEYPMNRWRWTSTLVCVKNRERSSPQTDFREDDSSRK